MVIMISTTTNNNDYNMYIYIYMYIYRERERNVYVPEERRATSRDAATGGPPCWDSRTPSLRYKIPVFSDPDPGKS